MAVRDDGIDVGHGVVIPRDELRFEFARSGGPGGQNVNKVNTQASLVFDIDASAAMSADQKRRVRAKLYNRINTEGLLRITASRHRTQAGNRRAAEERFRELLDMALTRPKVRKATRPSLGAKRRRLDAKKRQGEKKQSRSWGPGQD